MNQVSILAVDPKVDLLQMQTDLLQMKRLVEMLVDAQSPKEESDLLCLTDAAKLAKTSKPTFLKRMKEHGLSSVPSKSGDGRKTYFKRADVLAVSCGL